MENAILEKDNAVMEKKQTGEMEKSARREKKLREFIPSADVFENDEKFTLYLDLPGVKQEGLSIELERNVLTIQGEFHIGDSDKKDGYGEFHREGRYVRSFNIKAEIDRDHIEASLSNGVLKLILPRIEPVVKKITINAG